MNKKTYALFDLIGITDVIKNNTASDLLEKFWNAANAWTNLQFHEAMRILDKNCIASPDVHVTTFSDSALLYVKEELEIDDFYKIVKDFKSHIEQNACGLYAIVSRNSEISQPPMPPLVGCLLGSDNMPRYIQVAGSGDAWVNLHLADKEINKKKEWHGKYSLYCIGEGSLPSNRGYSDSIECKGLSYSTQVYAIE